ncbi:MAG TPA: hypothetical protein VHW02_04620 [Rhizomicrobium sp.]|jgi:hypothetical protein|nr:hypothetical protein [Rhizomicrobium sp.]
MAGARFGAVLFLLYGTFLLSSVAMSAAAAQKPAWITSDHNEKVALKYLWQPLKSERKGARVYYGMSECNGLRWNTPFPEILISRPSKDITDVAALRRFFVNDSSVRISDGNGIVRIRFGEIPAAILQTKIAEIKLSPEDQYNPELAMMKIENAPEVRDRMRKLGIRTLSLPMNMILTPPTKGFFHLPPVLREITMDEALDVIAVTFNGLVETAYCSKARLINSDVTSYDRH